MEIDKIIKKLCIDNDISLADLARTTGQSPQSLSNKLARKDLKVSELETLLHVLNKKLVIENL